MFNLSFLFLNSSFLFLVQNMIFFFIYHKGIDGIECQYISLQIIIICCSATTKALCLFSVFCFFSSDYYFLCLFFIIALSSTAIQAFCVSPLFFSSYEMFSDHIYNSNSQVLWNIISFI